MVAIFVFLVFAPALAGGIAISRRWNGLAGIAGAIAIGVIFWAVASLALLFWFANSS
jgi:hypothetical protein